MKICLVGNQNSGKTTLFNCLTGMNQKIGNWPGVTIEKKIGVIKGTDYEIVDLPGIYSLNPYTEEEKVSTNYILHQKPDLIINIVDATCLERSLYLTTQLIDINSKIIIALNMIDVLNKKGIKIDIQNLEYELKAPICEISAVKQTGIDNLIKQVLKMGNCEKCINSCYSRFNNKNKTANLFFDEESITKRYNNISRIVKKCEKRERKWKNLIDSLDKIFLSKTFSIPIFIIIMFFIYSFSVGIIGNYFSGAINNIVNILSIKLSSLMLDLTIPEWIHSLMINGIFKGITTVLSFLPQLTALFFCISILESTGYMPRIAFMLNGLLHKLGLSGKAIVPFIIGSGCSVPGIMATRIIENTRERNKVIALVPFIPCSAKLPIISLFAGYFFKGNEEVFCFLIYFLAILIILLSSIIFKKITYDEENCLYITELPDYRLPNIKYVLRDVRYKVYSFIKKAGTIILLASIVIWFLLSFNTKLEYGLPIENSILASMGKKISWIFYPMLGVNSWQASISSIQGLIAKEQVISSMAIISGFEENNINNGIFEFGGSFNFFTKWSSLAFIIFNLFSAPCFATIIAIRQEIGSFTKTIKIIAYQITIAWIIATLIYQFSLLLF